MNGDVKTIGKIMELRGYLNPNLFILDGADRTPVDLAIELGNQKIVDIL
jgi:hypothetical protein